MARSQRKHLRLGEAFRSFIGHLEGTAQAAHTIKNYRSDLKSFEAFLTHGLGARRPELSQITQTDLERFHGHLKAQGLKTNTRRRKLHTIRRFLQYLTRRKKLSIDVGKKLPTPAKIERIPMTVSYHSLLEAIRALPADPGLPARNRAMLWLLAETGCQVSEVQKVFGTFLRPAAAPHLARTGGAPGVEDAPVLSHESNTHAVEFLGKAPRSVPISAALAEALQTIARGRPSDQALFVGHNKFGPLKGAITARGVEMLVRSYADQLGFPELTPRLFRHSAVLHWHQQGMSNDAIRERLGLKTLYAFRTYQPLFKRCSAPNCDPPR